MRRFHHPIALMVGVQALCLGVGFWFQYQLTISTAEHDAHESAWSNLAMSSRPIVNAISQFQAHQLTTGTAALSQAQTLLDSGASTGSLPLLLTDAQGRILCISAEAASAQWQIGDKIIWRRDREAMIPGESQFGRLKTYSGESLTAVAYPAVNGGVQVVAYAVAATDPAWKKSLMSALPQASGLAFIWTLILSAGATYLLSSRFNFKETLRREHRDHEALRSAQDLLRTRDAVIFGLAKLAESRDPETGDHLERISLYTTRLATAIRLHPQYQRIVTPTFIRLLGISSVLHDIGKVGLEDTVLLKPGRLTADERKKMQEHTLVAGACLKEIEQRLGASNFLQTAREIAFHHHERWDGGGYPAGLAGDDIPLAARIVSICDVYDAMRSKRVYKEAFPHEDCVRAIRDGAGTQFDPGLVEVFLEIESEFAEIAVRFANADACKGEPSSSNLNHDQIASSRMSSDQEAKMCDVVGGLQSSIDCQQVSASVA